MRDLTDQEREAINALALAWNAFLALPRLHPDELAEFRHGLHALQNIVMSRPALQSETPGDDLASLCRRGLLK